MESLLFEKTVTVAYNTVKVPAEIRFVTNEHNKDYGLCTILTDWSLSGINVHPGQDDTPVHVTKEYAVELLESTGFEQIK